jgi:hypothetical protein
MAPRRVRPITTAAALVVTLTLAACGADEIRPAAARADTTERYCALVRAMDAAGSKFFASLERNNNATAKDFEAAERRFVRRFARRLEQIERAAPTEIRADVRVLLAGQRQRAGLGGSVDEAQVGAAEARVEALEKRRCH